MNRIDPSTRSWQLGAAVFSIFGLLQYVAFVLALGEVDDLKYATAAGAINFGFPVIAEVPRLPRRLEPLPPHLRWPRPYVPTCRRPSMWWSIRQSP